MNSFPLGQPGDCDTRLPPSQQTASKHEHTEVLALPVPTSMKFPLWGPQVTCGQDGSSPSSLKRALVYFLPQWEGQAGKAIMTRLRKAFVKESDRPGSKPALPLKGCVTPSKGPPLAASWFPHQTNRNKIVLPASRSRLQEPI